MEERVKTAEYWINEQLTLLMTVLQAVSKDFEERFSGEMDRLLYEVRLEQGITRDTISHIHKIIAIISDKRNADGYWESVQDFPLYLLPYLKAVSVYDRKEEWDELLERNIIARRRKMYTELVEFVDLEWKPMKDRICLKAICMLMESIRDYVKHLKKKWEKSIYND